jgi:hypothetical protein
MAWWPWSQYHTSMHLPLVREERPRIRRKSNEATTDAGTGRKPFGLPRRGAAFAETAPRACIDQGQPSRTGNRRHGDSRGCSEVMKIVLGAPASPATAGWNPTRRGRTRRKDRRARSARSAQERSRGTDWTRLGRTVDTRTTAGFNTSRKDIDPGDWRSWLARLLDMQEVTGSSPVSPIQHVLVSQRLTGDHPAVITVGNRGTTLFTTLLEVVPCPEAVQHQTPFPSTSPPRCSRTRHAPVALPACGPTPT